MSTHPLPARKIEITVGWPTLLKLFLFGLFVMVAMKLLPLAGMLLLALFIAVTLAPISTAIQRRGGPKWLAITACALIVFGGFGLFLFFVLPLAGNQISELIKALPRFKETALHHLPESGSMREIAEGLLQSPSFSDPAPLMKRFIDWATIAATGLIQLLLMFVMSIYLVADGRRIYEWLAAFLPPRQQQRVAKAAPEIESIIFSYMGGQLITSLLCAGFVFATLTLLHVPNAMLLAIVAGIFDVVPIIGFFLAVVPAAAMAATVSGGTALLVAALYTAYHLFENYFIVPKVYGNRLRLSGLTVFVICLAGGMVAGIIGVILILPIVASFPTFERIWLRPALGSRTVEKHEEILEAEHPSEENAAG